MATPWKSSRSVASLESIVVKFGFWLCGRTPCGMRGWPVGSCVGSGRWNFAPPNVSVGSGETLRDGGTEDMQVAASERNFERLRVPAVSPPCDGGTRRTRRTTGWLTSGRQSQSSVLKPGRLRSFRIQREPRFLYVLCAFSPSGPTRNSPHFVGNSAASALCESRSRRTPLRSGYALSPRIGCL